MSELTTFTQSLRRGEILLPLLKEFLRLEQAAQDKKLISHKDIVVQDAQMSIKCFQQRIAEHNHGEEIVGEYFHPSQLGQCMRKLFFDVYHAPENGKARGDDLLHDTMIFEMGTYFHVLFQNLCERAGYLTRREIAIKNDKIKILGHGDGELLINDIRYLLEIKTCNSRTFIGLNDIKEEHKKQIAAYLKGLNLKWAIVIYFDKDRANLKEFVFQYEESYWVKEIFPRINKFFTSIKGKILPDREGSSPNAFPCSYCQFSHLCFSPVPLAKWMKALKTNENKTKAKNPTSSRSKLFGLLKVARSK